MMTYGPVVPTWRKSTYSSLSGGECVETAGLGGPVGVRDSKDVERGHLVVPAAAWVALTGVLKG